jgi:hypothetical protein
MTMGRSRHAIAVGVQRGRIGLRPRRLESFACTAVQMVTIMCSELLGLVEVGS